VQTGESMFAICKKYYGSADADAIDALAKYNKINDPETLRAGRRLRIPSSKELGLPCSSTDSTVANDTATANVTIGTPRPSSMRVVHITGDAASTKSTNSAKDAPAKTPHVTYTVKPGETLRVIALKVMGTKNKWNKLYDLNRDVIDDPDNLKV